MAGDPEAPFASIEQCRSEGREQQTVVSDLDGTLLRGRSSFPYFMLVAFEASGVARSAALLLAAPLAWLLYHLVSEAAGIKVLVFVSMAGLRAADIRSVAQAVLPKFYAEDLHPHTWRVFSSFGKRYVVTANPRIMVEPFAKEYLLADEVLGSEIQVTGSGRATGFLQPPGVLVGQHKAAALLLRHPDLSPDCGLGDRKTDWPFMALCREAYLVPPPPPSLPPLDKERLAKPVVFHDGRLACRPTPLLALLALLWLPLGVPLALLRIAAGSCLPMRAVRHAFRALGVRVEVRGTPPSGPAGVLFVCSHRTLLDPIFLSAALGRPVAAVTYSISRLSELLSPIRTVPLSRDRAADAANIRRLLREGDLAICPEGTTCREPFLLRFSALFAELADRIVPVAMSHRTGMFHGTTARGWKGLDPFYFFLNPLPVYRVTFLDELPRELTCAAGRPAHEVANYIQRLLAATLSFRCTNLTRKDKYRALAGNDGSVPLKLLPPPTTTTAAAY